MEVVQNGSRVQPVGRDYHVQAGAPVTFTWPKWLSLYVQITQHDQVVHSGPGPWTPGSGSYELAVRDVPLQTTEHYTILAS